MNSRNSRSSAPAASRRNLAIPSSLLALALGAVTPAFGRQGAAPAPPAPAGGAQGQGAAARPPQDAGGNRQGRGQGQNGPNGQNGQGGPGQGGGRFNFGPGGNGIRGMGMLRRFTDAFRQEYLRRDLPLFRDQLELDESQAQLVETLLGDYESAFSPAAQSAQTQMQDLATQMVQTFFDDSTRQKLDQAMQAVQRDLEGIAADGNGQISPEVRAKIIRDRMGKLQDDYAKEREKSGAAVKSKAVMSQMVDSFEKWRNQSEQLTRTFLDGTKATLRESQMQKWPTLERLLTREKTLPHGVLSGENVNLFLVVDNAGLSKESMATIMPVLDTYELELDAALRARNDYLKQSELKFLKLAQDGNTRDAEQIAKKQVELHQSVRDVNDRYREAVVMALPVADREKVQRAILVAGYDRIYRPTQTERSFEAALKFDSLNPDMKTAIEALQTEYESSLGSMNERIVTLTRKQEPQQTTEDLERFMSMLNGMPTLGGARGLMGGRTDTDPTQELYTKRGELNDSYLRRLKDLLTPEQQAQLPQRQRGGRGGQGGNNGGGMLGDGTIANMPQQIQAVVKAYDTNNDGVIDDSERQAAIEALRQQGVVGGRNGGGGQRGGGATGGNPGGNNADPNGQGGGRRNRGGGGRGGQAGGGAAPTE